jgi:Mg-chelatase subunit ChlD
MRLFLAALGLTLAVTSAPAAAQDGDPAKYALLVVLDVSGSMNEEVPGGVKRELARQGLLRTFEALPEGTLAGLRLLGQGASADECAASQNSVAFAPFVAADWDAALDEVRWDGATPLVYSMREALDELRQANALRREMLIIGDGEETCGEDPVGVAREEAGDIRIHTISLGEGISHQLAGIALVTDGTYARAFDETTFDEAAEQAVPGGEEPGPGGTAPAGAGAGAAPSRLEVILDVSNSMWGQVGGQAKIELAREALGGALADFPADVPVGLRAYGHRVSFEDDAAGCVDTERLLPPAVGNAAEVVRLANTLAPRGQTPIARSLEEAGADLQTEGGAAVILLVSDGVESCGGDPEAVAADLRASGLQVVLHTVGLGVTPDEAQALAALADAGGGTYFDAPTADDLIDGVTTAVESSTMFVLREDDVPGFPRDAVRVRGGATVAEAEVLVPGTFYSFTEHMFREEVYFAVAGTPGDTLTLRGMVAALEIGRTRAGVVTFQGFTNMMMGQRVDAAGERLRGGDFLLRGDMGESAEMEVEVGADGFARFRLGRTQGNVHRDMVFSVNR